MQKLSQLICLVVLVLVAATCMARTVVNRAGVDDHLHHLINKDEGPIECGNATLDITGCLDGDDCYGFTNSINGCIYIDARNNYCANATIRICFNNALCGNGTIKACTDFHASNAATVCNAAVVGACNDAGTRIATSSNGAAVAVAVAACNAAGVGACATADRNARAHRVADGSGK
jgi:hypothetical protein